MFRFDYGVSQQGSGGHREGSGRRSIGYPTLNERDVAPAIYWSARGGCAAGLRLSGKNQMSD